MIIVKTAEELNNALLYGFGADINWDVIPESVIDEVLL